MNTNIKKLIELNELVGLEFHSKHKIVLNPNDNDSIDDSVSSDVITDGAQWKIPNELKTVVKYLSKNKMLTDEQKILVIYELMCQSYVYDDNVLSFLKKIDDDKYGLPDWYARVVDSEFTNNREKHNRRVCYEVSRDLAMSLSEVFKNDENYNVCILWNKDLTHYFVGLSNDKYSITLDLDDFYNIKDLTRLKTGLTAEGIKILKDDENIFTDALNQFNAGKGKHAIIKIAQDINNKEHIYSDNNINENETDQSDNIIFMKNVVEVLNDDYDLDSQGIFEFIKEVADLKLGPESRKKVWKKLDSTPSTRYTRCLVVRDNNKEYIIDVDKKILRPFDEEEFNKDNPEFVPYKELDRDWDERYDGL